MSSSPNVLVNGSPVAGVGANVLAGATVTVALQDSTGVATWVLICTSTDELNTVAATNATLIINQTTKTATYTQPSTATGSAVQFTSTVDTGISTTFGVFVLDPLGTRLFFPGETSESSGSFGVVADLNALGRSTLSVPNATSTTPGAIILTKDLGGVYNAPLVVGLQGNPIKVQTLGAAQDGYVLSWVNADSKYEAVSVNSIAVAEATTTSFGTIKLAGDLSGAGTVAAAPTVASVTGASAADTTINAPAGNSIVLTGTPRLLFLSTLASPVFAQSDLSTNSGTGQLLSIHAQNETGTTSVGGALTLASGTGTSTAGALSIKCGSTTLISLPTTTSVSIGSSTSITTISGGVDGYVSLIGNANYTVDSSSKDYLVLASVASSTKTITLPAHVVGRMVTIKDIAGNLSATITMTIARNGGTGNIENVAASYVATAPFVVLRLVSDGSNWWLI